MPKCYRLTPSRPHRGWSRSAWSLFAWSLIFALVAASAASADAGVELRSTTTLHGEDPPRVDRTLTRASGGSLRIDVGSGEKGAEDPRNTTIFRGAFGDFLVVDHGERAFTLIDDEAIEELEAQLQYTMLQLDRKMAELPPEQRQRMRDALEAPAPLEIRVEETDETAEKGGFPCRLVKVYRGEELAREVWVASWDDVPGGGELQAAHDGLEAFTARLDEAFKSVRSLALGGAQVFETGDNPFADLGRLGGLPVHTVHYEDGEPSFETVIDSVRSLELSPRDFLPPDSYRRRSWTGE